MSDANSSKKHQRSVSPVPAHANAQAHEKVMTWLSKASTSDVMKASVKAGVYNPNGTLTEHYKKR